MDNTATSTAASTLGRRMMTSARASYVLVAVVIVAGLLATVWSWRAVRNRAAAVEHERFAKEFDMVSDSIRDRFRSYADALRGGAGLFGASATVERGEWRAYVETIGVIDRYPGIQGMGYSVRIPADKKDAHVAAVRAEGFPAYDIRPAGDRPEYQSIVYLEPFTNRNLRAFGYDMSTEETRRTAMERARDEAAPAMSGRVVLVQETSKNQQSGFLLYLPIYRKGQPASTAEERRSALEGYVYGVFRADDFMASAIGAKAPGVAVQIFDGPNPGADTLMHDGTPKDLPAGYRFRFDETQTISNAGCKWSLRIRSLPEFDRMAGNDLSIWVLGGGLLLTAFVGVFLLNVVRHASKVERLVSRRTAELKHANAKLRQENAERRRAEEQRGETLRSLAERNGELERFNHLAVGRELRMIELKAEINALSRASGGVDRFDLGFVGLEPSKKEQGE